MATKQEKAIKILELLEHNTSIAIVKGFIKDKGLRYSAGSWDDIRNNRILPYIGKGLLTLADLEQLLINTEEYGKQHIFLYKCSKGTAKELIEKSRVIKVVTDLGLKNLLNSPRILNEPQKPTLSDIRIEDNNPSSSLTIKYIETRWRTELIGEDIYDNIITKKWKRISERAVNIVCLHSDGLLEIRIGSHTNSSKYDSEVIKAWDLISEIIPKNHFREVSLSNAKRNLLENQGKLKNKIRYSTATLKNDYGNLIQAAAGSTDTSLSDDDGVSGSIEEFIKHDGYCDKVNIWFSVRKDSNALKSDIHVLISGMVHEFAIPANCVNNDYEYVLKEIRELNK